MMIMKYRKKPVVIEAVQWTEDVLDDAALASLWEFCPVAARLGVGPFTNLVVKTLEGDMLVSHGDWIIKGIKGEFYPCKPDIFAASYEPS
jgi:hypothetical protein